MWSGRLIDHWMSPLQRSLARDSKSPEVTEILGSGWANISFQASDRSISRSDYPLRMDYTLFVKHFPHAAISVYVAYCIKCQRTFGFGSQPPLQR